MAGVAAATTTVVTVNISGMADRYLSQTDISRLLGKERTRVSVWRDRYPDFPAHDVEIGFVRPVPGWKEKRMDEIRAWLAAHPELMREKGDGGA